MREVAQAEREQFWTEVREEFPDDPMMQEIHYIRLVHHAQTKDLSLEELVRFFETAQAGAAATGTGSSAPAGAGLPGSPARRPALNVDGSNANGSPRRDVSGAITNADQLTADDVAHQRVICPGCREKVFAMWPEGWDAHAAFRCGGVRGTREQRKTEFRRRLAHLFRSR